MNSPLRPSIALLLLMLTATFAPALDQNSNQQSDVWEMIFNAAGLAPGADADGDGFSNREEAIAGTDPFDAASFPWIEAASRHGDHLTNRFVSAAGKVYQWHGGAELGMWTFVTNVTGTGGEQQAGMAPTGGAYFLRFAVSDQDTDGDGLTDWDELAVGFDPATNRTDRYEQTDNQRVAAALNAMSTVTVAVLDGAISERWPDPGVFAIRRAGGLKPLVVHFTLGGSATRDIDYTMPPGNQIAIPPGVREVWVEVMPVADDDHGETDETISLTVTGGSGYVVGANSNGVILLANETPTSPPSPKAAARFLVQAAFGPDQDSTNDVDQLPENVEDVMAMGFEAWIDDQFTRPIGFLQPFTEYAMTSIPEFYTDPKQAAWWNRAMGVPALTPTNAPQLPDPLRQRVGFALSQILVIGDRPETLAVQPAGMANYYDMLLTHAFGNYRDLLMDVTLHPCMGFYLSHLQNRKPDPASNIHPDENYAREIKQLFAIGLWELNQDGTRRLGTNGLPIPSYDNSHITEFARVFTGLSYGPSNAPAFLTGQANFTVPMKMWDDYHDCDPKTLLNDEALPARTPNAPFPGAAGLADLDAAIDNLFWHTNVAPFIGRQLIQRLVTSNPSTGYVARVSAAFNDNGSGVRGDMKAVIKAILLDDEARNPAFMSDPAFGKMREPFLRVVNLARAFNAAADAGYYALDDFNIDHYQQPMNSPSVFNFYLPGYIPPGALNEAGLVGPEFQILNAGSSISAPNYYLGAVRNGLHRWGTSFPDRSVRLNLTQEIAMAGDVDALIRRMDLALMYGTLSPREFQVIREAVQRIHTGLWQWDQERVYLAIYLMITSPECAVAR
ncbi:MAG TPA: DUF1800 family protein [Kiritimatiellia bacterium]|nr:DUF1800 family protein [Kiritimatiellia bacterium]